MFRRQFGAKKERRQWQDLAPIEQTIAEVRAEAEKLVAAAVSAASSSKDAVIWDLMQAVNKKAQNIASSNKGSCSSETKTLVLMVQKYRDYVLGNSSEYTVPDFDPKTASELDKIFKIGALASQFQAGNCQEKSFFAFAELIKEFMKEKVATVEKAIPLELAYFNDHFFLIVNNQFVFDPWIDVIFPFSGIQSIEKVFRGFGRLKPYFILDENWCCFVQRDENAMKSRFFTESPGHFFDRSSTASTFSLFDMPIKPSQIASPGSDYFPEALRKYRKIQEEVVKPGSRVLADLSVKGLSVNASSQGDSHLGGEEVVGGVSSQVGASEVPASQEVVSGTLALAVNNLQLESCSAAFCYPAADANLANLGHFSSKRDYKMTETPKKQVLDEDRHKRLKLELGFGRARFN
jgi:hypothetical protein